MTTLGDAVEVLLSPALELSTIACALDGKRVLHRLDLNLPLAPDSSGALRVQDDTRLRAALPSVKALLAAGARVALCSHLGRPEPSKQDAAEMRAAYSLSPVADVLAEQLGDAFVGLVPDCVGPEAAAAVQRLQPGQACLLENLRFHDGEAANDDAFARELAAPVDVYVNDAFGAAHRDQASVTGILNHVPECYPGLLLRSELQYLHTVCNSPVRPFGVIIGGAKVKDKLPVLASLVEKADMILIGGRMAFTFLAAEGVAVGRTQIEEQWLEACRDMRARATERGVQLLLPSDAVVARSLDDDHGCCIVPLTRGCCSSESPCVPDGCFGLDIGPKTATSFAHAISGCKTLFWNGPMGRFEVPGFAAGTAAIAHALGTATTAGATTILGGGDSVSAVNKLQPVPPMSYISTGGGASLELIRGEPLPGITALARAAMRRQA